ncbi:MAG TPA: hypothetical protein VFB79_09190 [Candidatus Angelobacter sp.]|nr:hypothetical protein [Candidatus Angelobacter sp.]
MEHRDYSGAIRWQVDQGVPVTTIARLFNKSASSIPVIVWRDVNRLIPRKVENTLYDTNLAGMAADELLRDIEINEDELKAPLRLTELEQQIDAFGRHFWEKVRDHAGAKELGLLLRKVSRPSWENISLRRAGAKLYHLLAEIYLHAGCCRSSLEFGVRACRAEERLYKETLSKDELFSIGKTSLLISQALINRSEFDTALPWIKRSKRAFEAGSHPIDPEHYKQLATVQLHSNAVKEAHKNYQLAGRLLANYKYKPNATAAEIKDISERHLYITDSSSDWEKAFNLMEYALKSWPKDDIHKGLNVNWAAAAGLSSDSPEGNRSAIKLLRDKTDLSRGYLHPQTVTELLLMTPELPRQLRPEWARFCLHYNAFRNK